MLRDKIKTDTYFNEFISYEEKRIEKFLLLVKKVIQERGKDDRGVKNGYIAVQGYYFNKLRAMYSAGYSLENIREFLPEVIDIMEKVWNKESGYIRMLWMMSIAVMLDIEDKEFKRLVTMVRKEGLNDYLINYFIAYRNDKFVSNMDNYNQSEFYIENPYSKLKEVIESNKISKEKSLESLEKYIRLFWYKGHSDEAWYDAHENKHDIYSGYWSFESGAIAKILKLDDSALKDTPYYPYDMVHYKEK
ncbi:PoNi-like cognate immunity protein [Bacillus sp. JZ8]